MDNKKILEIIVGILLIAIFLWVVSYLSNGEGIRPDEPAQEIVEEVDPNDPYVKWAGPCGDDGDCFNWKFQNCIEDYKIEEIQDILISRSDILGMKDGLCETRLQYTKHPNPNILNKALFCKYDNSLPYDESIQNPVDCYEEDLEVQE